MAKSPIVLPLSTTFLQRISQHFSTDGERNLIGRRTESDRTADGIQSDGERNLIGRRTETDRTADANDGTLRGCTCLKCTNRARNTSTEQELRQQSKSCTNRARTAPSASPLRSNILPQNTQNSQNLLLRILPQISRKYTDCLGAENKNNGLSG